MTQEQRALAILRAVLFIAEEGEFDKFQPDNGSVSGARLIEQAPWRARLTPNHRIALARQSEHRIATTVKPEEGCLLFELEMFGDMALQVNVRGDEAQLYLFKPGVWESRFGVDCGGDSVPVTPFVFADPADPRWQAFVQSPDFQWPPNPQVSSS